MCHQPPGTNIYNTFKSSHMRGRFIHIPRRSTRSCRRTIPVASPSAAFVVSTRLPVESWTKGGLTLSAAACVECSFGGHANCSRHLRAKCRTCGCSISNPTALILGPLNKKVQLAFPVHPTPNNHDSPMQLPCERRDNVDSRSHQLFLIIHRYGVPFQVPLKK